MRSVYPSDISRERFEIILPDLESCRKKTKPRKLDLYDVFCGVLYVLKSGCQWRMLPKAFPKWRNCYNYFKKWSEKPSIGEESILECVKKKLVGEVRRNNGRKEKTSFCIIDAQSVKNADTAERKGYDAGKKILGIKHHIAVDTQGLPHAIYVTTAEAADRSSAVKMVKNAKENLSEVKNILVDAGYTGENFATQIKATRGNKKKRITYLCCIAKKMGCREVFCLVGKM